MLDYPEPWTLLSSLSNIVKLNTKWAYLLIQFYYFIINEYRFNVSIYRVHEGLEKFYQKFADPC